MYRHIYIDRMDKLFFSLGRKNTQLAVQIDLLLMRAFMRWYFPNIVKTV
jgi:hypothetical protein